MRSKIKDILIGIDKAYVTFEIPKYELENLESYREKDLNVTVKECRKHRSTDANALMWACIGDIAKALNADKWDIYLQMLRRYGKFTHICVKPNAVEAVKRQWRESEIVGDIDINGKPAVQMLCYYGSSTYDSKEFSQLVDGIISEMAEMGLQTPASDEMRMYLEELK